MAKKRHPRKGDGTGMKKRTQIPRKSDVNQGVAEGLGKLRKRGKTARGKEPHCSNELPHLGKKEGRKTKESPEGSTRWGKERGRHIRTPLLGSLWGGLHGNTGTLGQGGKGKRKRKKSKKGAVKQ